MRSIFLDSYIGSLLQWRSTGQNLKDLFCEPVYGHKGGDKPVYVVLDGQQRLTALHYAFVAPDVPLPKRKTKLRGAESERPEPDPSPMHIEARAVPRPLKI